MATQNYMTDYEMAMEAMEEAYKPRTPSKEEMIMKLLMVGGAAIGGPESSWGQGLLGGLEGYEQGIKERREEELARAKMGVMLTREKMELGEHLEEKEWTKSKRERQKKETKLAEARKQLTDIITMYGTSVLDTEAGKKLLEESNYPIPTRQEQYQFEVTPSIYEVPPERLPSEENNLVRMMKGEPPEGFRPTVWETRERQVPLRPLKSKPDTITADADKDVYEWDPIKGTYNKIIESTPKTKSVTDFDKKVEMIENRDDLTREQKDEAIFGIKEKDPKSPYIVLKEYDKGEGKNAKHYKVLFNTETKETETYISPKFAPEKTPEEEAERTRKIEEAKATVKAEATAKEERAEILTIAKMYKLGAGWGNIKDDVKSRYMMLKEKHNVDVAYDKKTGKYWLKDLGKGKNTKTPSVGGKLQPKGYTYQNGKLVPK